MKRSEIRTFVEDGVELLSPQVAFGEGRRSEVHTMNNITTNTFCWRLTSEDGVDSDPTATSNNFDSWPIQILILKKDTLDSLPKDYEALIDDCDFIAQQLIASYQITVDNWDLTVMEGINRSNVIKEFDGPFTGVLLSFNLLSPDKTDAC